MKDYPSHKQFALDILGRLSDAATIDDLREEFDLILGLLESYEDQKAGRMIPHAQVVAEAREWISKSVGRPEPTVI